MPKREPLKPGKVRDIKRWYYIPTDKPRITDESIVLTKKFEDHEPSRDHQNEEYDEGYDEHGNGCRELREGAHRWATTDIQEELAKFEARLKEYEVCEQGEKKSYKVPIRVCIRTAVENGDVSIEYEIVEPYHMEEEVKVGKKRKRKSDAEENELEDKILSGKTAFTIVVPLFDAAHSEFPEK